MFYFKFIVKSILKWFLFFIVMFLGTILYFLKWLLDLLKRFWYWLLNKCPKCKKKKRDCECKDCSGCGEPKRHCDCEEDENGGSEEYKIAKKQIDDMQKKVAEHVIGSDESIDIPSPHNFEVKTLEDGTKIATSEYTEEVWEKKGDYWDITNPEVWKK